MGAWESNQHAAVLPLDESTLGGELQSVGYATHIVGA
jgi:hypothetical protein